MDPIRYEQFRTRVFDAVNGKSDRDCVVTIVAWIDHLLVRKIQVAIPSGNSNANTLAKRIDVAHRMGWIDRELRADLHKLRKVRNEFAHSIDVSSLSEATLQPLIHSLIVPRRQYYDWDRLGAVARRDGSLVIYAGDRPDDAVEDLAVGGLLFKLGLSVIFSVLVANLKIEFTLDEENTLFVPSVPVHLHTIINPSSEGRS